MPTESFDQHLSDFCADVENKVELKALEIAARLAKDIRDRRKTLGIGQVQFAQSIGTTQSRVSQIEDPTYGKFTLNTLVRIAEALNCELEISFKMNDISMQEILEANDCTAAVNNLARSSMVTNVHTQQEEVGGPTEVRAFAKKNLKVA
jgi:predicted transcriptional regulator